MLVVLWGAWGLFLSWLWLLAVALRFLRTPLPAARPADGGIRLSAESPVLAGAEPVPPALLRHGGTNHVQRKRIHSCSALFHLPGFRTHAPILDAYSVRSHGLLFPPRGPWRAAPGGLPVAPPMERRPPSPLLYALFCWRDFQRNPLFICTLATGLILPFFYVNGDVNDLLCKGSVPVMACLLAFLASSWTRRPGFRVWIWLLLAFGMAPRFNIPYYCCSSSAFHQPGVEAALLCAPGAPSG